MRLGAKIVRLGGGFIRWAVLTYTVVFWCTDPTGGFLLVCTVDVHSLPANALCAFAHHTCRGVARPSERYYLAGMA